MMSDREKTGRTQSALRDSKWAISGVFNPLQDRKARGLSGTYQEELADSWLWAENKANQLRLSFEPRK